MRRSKTLAKFRSGQPARFCALGHYIPAFIRLAADHDYDCIWLDLEHRAMDDREIQGLLAFFHLHDIDCMLRPPTLEKTRLYRYLEDGATGLMIPHVSDAQKARDLVQAVKFPPLGDRGIDAAGLDANYGLPDAVEYSQAANRETFLVVQIETPQAVRNVDEIAAVEGVDGIFFGPGDLNLRLRTLEHESMSLESARQQVAEACAKHDKPWGHPCGSQDDLGVIRDMGARMLVHGGDHLGYLMMFDHCRQNLDAVLQAE